MGLHIIAMYLEQLVGSYTIWCSYIINKRTIYHHAHIIHKFTRLFFHVFRVKSKSGFLPLPHERILYILEFKSIPHNTHITNINTIYLYLQFIVLNIQPVSEFIENQIRNSLNMTCYSSYQNIKYGSFFTDNNLYFSTLPKGATQFHFLEI